MAEKKRPATDEDPAQSKRFLELANELEAAGELNLTEAEGQFDRLSGKALPERKPTGKPGVSQG